MNEIFQFEIIMNEAIMRYIRNFIEFMLISFNMALILCMRVWNIVSLDSVRSYVRYYHLCWNKWTRKCFYVMFSTVCLSFLYWMMFYFKIAYLIILEEGIALNARFFFHPQINLLFVAFLFTI